MGIALGGPPLRPPRSRSLRSGYFATGPGFYIWEEHRGDALRAALDLSPLGAKPVAQPVAGGPRRRRASPR
jgi:hypothetical protein